ncbi:hypothetical protein C9374_004298 [Naegleria lovaniensis]|uniref:Large ribosomal subunit protein eL22 n=1 Tax=Naegleria lovaniensis TaxID=51637 RepID=A0AA88KJX8_NAELO|nr:uncharacterized protein C9374_004298 [Naegleria lovaniensis]KAG2383627.1 hypothetical protein C9374_004298 [Naegleria lovaniensis]
MSGNNQEGGRRNYTYVVNFVLRQNISEMVRKGATPTVGKRIKGEKKTRQITYKFHIDARVPVQDGIMDLDHFEKYFREKFKVDGKAGNLKEKVRFHKKLNRLYVFTEVKTSKRYLKYLTKKYLKKNNLRDWLHVVSKQNQRAYELRYYNIAGEQEEAAEQQEEEETKQ